MSRSPFHITPDDLIKDSKERLAWMLRNYPARVLQGSMSAWSADHKIAMERARLKVFQNLKKDPQGVLFNQKN